MNSRKKVGKIEARNDNNDNNNNKVIKDLKVLTELLAYLHK